MHEYPLLFTFREIVEGNSFVAGVVCSGCSLMVDLGGEEGWHVSGVTPGGLSETGGSPHEAYFYFRQSFTHAVKVIAEDSANYADFEQRLTAFVNHKDVEEEGRWLAARKALQAGAEPDAPFKELPKETAEEPRGVKVLRLDFQKPGEQKGIAQQLAGPEEVGISTALEPAA